MKAKQAGMAEGRQRIWRRNSSLLVVIANHGIGDAQGLDDFGRDHFAFWLKICLDALLQ
jgi:hypothetical protein